MTLRSRLLAARHRLSRGTVAAAVAATVLAVVPATAASAVSHATAAHLSARPSATLVGSGSVVAVSGTVTPRVAGIPVSVQKLVGKKWASIASARSIAKGLFTVNVAAPRATGKWTIRAVAGKVTTGAFTLTVTKTAYKVTAKLVQKSVPHGSVIQVSGTVKPKAKGAVQLQYLDGVTWRTIGTAALTKRSTFVVSGKRPNGLSKLRVVKANAGVVAGGQSTTLKVTVRPEVKPVITTESLPAGIVGRSYSATIAAAGGVGPYTWTVTQGSLPEGLAINTEGAIGGTPLGVYTETFGVTVTGSDGGHESKALSIRIAGTSVSGWGSNASQQLVGATGPSRVPVPSGLSKVVSVVAGAYSAYALLADGTVWAWGDNSYGQLGNGGAPSERTNVPVQVSGLYQIVSIASGNQTAYAQRKDGTVFSWGFNVSGELGNGSLVNSNVPVQVKGLTFITRIAAGAWNAYALRSDGTLYGWGFDAHGEVGDGSVHLGGVALPSPIGSLTNVTSIGGGGGGGFAVRTDGSVWAWGFNPAGALGTASASDSAAPVQVAGVSNAVAVAGGTSAAYALRTDGTVLAWGGNGSGQLGNSSTTNSAAPVTVAGLTGVVAIAAGGTSAYAVKSDGTVWSWGGNGSGQLGNNTATDSHAPVQVSGVSGALAVSAGMSAAYALTSP